MTYLPARNAAQVESLFRNHHGWLNGWLRRKPRIISSSEDIASEVFLRLLTLPDLGELREPRAMMVTIAQRIIYELRRRNDLWQVCERDLATRSDTVVLSPEELLVIKQALAMVERMLETMEPKARAAFLYAKVDGMKQDVIAKKLGVSRATVERYIAQGLRRALALELGLL